MAYRTADHERWNDLDFVIGIEIKLSGNHPIEDICDEMCGVYPKTFKFVGWHPFCRCYAVPKLADEDEFIARQQALIDGNDTPQGGYTGEVTEMPQCFTDWVCDNADRIETAKSTPYFIQDNRAAVKAALRGASAAAPATIATATPAKRTIEQAAAERQAKRDAVTKAENYLLQSLDKNVEIRNSSLDNEKYLITKYKSGGEIQEPTIGSQTKAEKQKNLKLAEHMAKFHAMRLRLLPINPHAPKGMPQPDCLNLDNGVKVELKICNPETSNAKSSIQNAIKEGSRQGCGLIIVEFNKDVSNTSIYKGIVAALQPGRALGVQELLIKFADDRLKRYNLVVWRTQIEQKQKKRAK